jgi:hypothetical protein
MEFSFKNIFSALSIFGLMFGIISGMAFSILKILAQPLNPESWKDAGIEFAKIITNSQTEISKTVKIFPQAVKAGYGELALTRIIGASLITIFLIYIFYKGIRTVFFLENIKPTDKLIIVLVSIGLVWLLTIIASIVAGEPNFVPYSGFIDLIKNRQEIIDFIIKTYQK